MQSLSPLHIASTHLRLKPDGSAERLPVPKGTWHTANPLEPTTMVFITAGEGTQVRPRPEGTP